MKKTLSSSLGVALLLLPFVVFAHPGHGGHRNLLEAIFHAGTGWHVILGSLIGLVGVCAFLRSRTNQ